MKGGLTACPQSYSVFPPPRIPPAIQRRCCSLTPRGSHDNPLFCSTISSGLLKFSRVNLSCKSAGDSGENKSGTVLDAFFLGKALGEALTERIESSVGEFLSIIGRLQAEQQKQILEFQEEVFEKARRAKEQASKEAMEAQGRTSKSTSLGISRVNVVSETTSSKPNITKEDTLFGLLNED